MLNFLHSIVVKSAPFRAGSGRLGCSTWMMRVPLPSLMSYGYDGGVSEGILCHPLVGSVVGWAVMMRGVEPLFSVANCLKGTIVWEWENVLRAVDRLRI